MSRTLASFVLLATVGCKDEPTPIVVEPAEFSATAAAASLQTTLPESTVLAHDAHQGLTAVLGLVSADVNVQQFLNFIPEPIDMPCWTATSNGSSRSMDYLLCSGLATGSATLTDTPLGPKVLTTTGSFAFGGVGLSSGLGFTETAAASVFHRMAPTDGQGNPADALTVRVGDETVDLAIDGFFTMSTAAGVVKQWGTATASSTGGSTSFVIGSDDAAQVASSAEPSTSVGAPWLSSCRCASTGTIAYDTALTVDTLTVDLNGSLEGGGTLWPDLVVDLATDLPGQLVIKPGAECGAWTGTFVTTEPVTVSGDALRAAVDLACSNNSFNSPEDCERVRLAAASLDALPVAVSDRVWRETVELVSDEAFDNGFCSIPE